MPGIFISYRRKDSEFQTNELHQRLAREFGPESVFLDVDNIPPGVDFRDYLSEAVGRCNVLIAMIGPHWLDARNSDGECRIEDPTDYVRMEIQAALARDIPVIPVLLNAEMPTEDQLPGDLADLAYRNTYHVSPATLHEDLDRLVERLHALQSFSTARPLESPRIEKHAFRIESRVGRGGMGEVFLAWDETLGRKVALKRIRPELLNSDEAHVRFLQEARHYARLDHPGIVRILSVDRDDEGPFLVLEFMGGGSLRDRLAQGRVRFVTALAWIRQLLQALQAAHDKGIVHRDVKPENILFTESDVPRLADFGLASFQALDGVDRDDARAGTRVYLAPELRRSSDNPGPRTDLYAIGVTFLEMLTGLPPHKAAKAKLPASVSPIVRRLVAKDPNRRYDSAERVLQDIESLERSMELAGRNQKETLARLRQTVQQGYRHLADSQLPEAEACFERVLNESPEHDGARTGQLLRDLLAGDIARAEQKYSRLLEIDVVHPVFEMIHQFVESIRQPTILHATPQVVPFSYIIDELKQGRLVKELMELGRNTVNLGDIGELLIELHQQQAAGERLSYSAGEPGVHCIEMILDNLKVGIEFRHVVTRGRFLSQPRIEGSLAAITIRGSELQVYRLYRYLISNLSTRYRRTQMVDANLAGTLQIPPHAMEEWQRLDCEFERFAETGCTAD